MIPHFLGLWVEVGGKAIPNRCIPPVGCFAIKEDMVEETRNYSDFPFTWHRALQKALRSPTFDADGCGSTIVRTVPLSSTQESQPTA